MNKRFGLSTVLFATLLATAGGVHAETALRFGIYTSDKASSMVKQFRPIMNAIEADILATAGKTTKISIQVASDYDKGIADLVEGRVDFARFGPASYVVARNLNRGVRLLAMESNAGQKTFKGLIIVRSDSPVENVSDLRGARFAFGDSRSTIGRFLAQRYLLEHGLKAEDLREYHYLPRHDAVAMAVASGDYDAGAVKSRTYRKAVASGAPLRVLAEFHNVTKPWIARPGLDDQTFELLQDILLNLTNQQALKSLGKEGFLAGEDHEYDIVRAAMLASRAFHD